MRSMLLGICGWLLVQIAAAAAEDPSLGILNDPTVEAALAAAKAQEPECIENEVRICEIPAPPFKEEIRAAEIKRQFLSLGLKEVRIDAAGNVIGVRPGASAHPNLVLAGHLDTVFPPETEVKVTRKGSVLKAPGIGDDCRGLAVLLSVVRALDAGKVQTPGTVTFVADTGEEGLGDLRGTKQLFNVTLKGQIDKFVSIDGTGMDIEDIGVGSYRYRANFEGPGGHSYGAFGLVNPIHAMGRAIAKIDELQVKLQPKTTFNVGRVGGGTSVNAIASEAWMEIDMRSADKAALEDVRDRIQQAVDAAVAEENHRWGNRGSITAKMELLGFRPPGLTPADSAIVRTAIAVSHRFGDKVLVHEGSTDSNIPMSLGIPAITAGGGGVNVGAHSPRETFDTTDSWRGTQRALALVVALAR